MRPNVGNQRVELLALHQWEDVGKRMKLHLREPAWRALASFGVTHGCSPPITSITGHALLGVDVPPLQQHPARRLLHVTRTSALRDLGPDHADGPLPFSAGLHLYGAGKATLADPLLDCRRAAAETIGDRWQVEQPQVFEIVVGRHWSTPFALRRSDHKKQKPPRRCSASGRLDG